MFRSRTSARKPDDELLADFRQQFPEVSTGATEPNAPAISQTTTANFNPIINAPVHERAHVENEAFRDMDPTPRAVNDPWRFTPSLLDASAFSFNALTPGATAAQAYYPPTPGGSGTLLPPQVVEMHPPPNMAMTSGLETPLSVPTTLDIIQPSIEVSNLTGFPAIEAHRIPHFDPFARAPPPQPAFMPSDFVHHDTGYETMDHDGSPMDSDPSEERIPTIASTLHQQQLTGVQMVHHLPATAEKFRFHSTLNAPTAMIKHAAEIPVTYLNKGQAYTLSIMDTGISAPVSPGTRYRTYVRVSFEDDQQRQKPGVCWSLWKEGRGTSEAHQRGGRLQAVEYVEAGQPAQGDEKRTQVELESSSFDGFSVIWTPGLNGGAEVNIPVRFNFLSTDFSHSKGVKGIPVRLCAKTIVFSSDQLPSPPDAAPEICFCKVKLFRDHGAERKLSNDVAHVKKSIDKLKQQIAQAESGLKDFKRKRSSGLGKAGMPGKVHKHKRTWSMSSASSAGGAAPRLTLEEDLHFKLQTLQDMFTSTRPVSVLYLRGEELDDPDLHPVSLQGDSTSGKTDFLREGSNWQARSAHSSVAGSLVSPSPSSLSLASQASAMGPGVQWQNFDSTGVKRVENPTTISKTEEDGTLSGWIEALGVDPSYRPPPERPAKPVACFYVAYVANAEAGKKEYHRAIYLAARTLQELNNRIAAKWGLDASRIVRTIHATRTGIEVEMDDDVVQELKEGQDMQLEIDDVVEQPNTKREWEISIDDGPEASSSMSTGLALRLIF
ncbi:CP2 transcription factor domain-containing protein [Trichoderma ceciliae]